MADLRDEYGNPIQMTDELGNPVQLTDERGNPMHLKGVAATSSTTTTTDTGGFAAYNPGRTTPTDTHGGITSGPHTGATHGGTGVTMTDVIGSREHDQDKQGGEGEKGHVLGRSSSSSSSSSEDDGQGGRRKKSLKQKIKEKLPGGKHKEDRPQAAQGPGHGITSTASTTTTTTTTGGEHHEHEKKSMMEKIKEKLPGHHNH